MQLRQHLLKAFPGIVVPPVPGKKRKSFEQDYLRRRAVFLQKTLSDILSHPTLAKSPLLLDFLYIQNDTTFRSKQKDHDKLPRVNRVEQVGSP